MSVNHTRTRTVIVITGASAGVGRATAREFAREGVAVALIARGVEGLEAAKREVEERGGKALVLPLDVADAAAVEDAARKIEEELGPIDVWVNNAMVSVFSPVHQMEADEYRRVMEVTFLGYVHGTLAALKRMRARNRGVIVQVGSALAHRAIPLQSAYCAAKHAIEGFTESLRCELLHDKSGVHVTQVHMPAMNTPQFSWVKSRLPGKPQPVPPIYQPEVAARSIVWASRHPRREQLVAWPTVKAVFSERIAPWAGDWYLAKQGYESQQLPEPVEPDRKDNLWQPLPGDAGAHGTFADRSRSTSLQAWSNRNRRWLGFIAGVVAVFTIARRVARR